MTEIVHDIDRPDVGGVPPKMLKIGQQTQEALKGLVPHLFFNTNDNLCSSVYIHGTFDPKEDWSNGIFQNGLYFIISIQPEKGKRYYEEGMKVTVELASVSYKVTEKIGRMRKYTGPVDKVLAKIVKWIKSYKETS
jgi:hypothetical protein